MLTRSKCSLLYDHLTPLSENSPDTPRSSAQPSPFTPTSPPQKSKTSQSAPSSPPSAAAKPPAWL